MEGSFEVARADGGAGEVEEYADVPAARSGLAADVGGDFASPVVLGVAHVDAEDVGSVLDHLSDVFWRAEFRSDGGDDFGFTNHKNRDAWCLGGSGREKFVLRGSSQK